MGITREGMVILSSQLAVKLSLSIAAIHPSAKPLARTIESKPCSESDGSGTFSIIFLLIPSAWLKPRASTSLRSP
ncbi:hypothetical protein C8J56DRAFT_1061816 [Mycena floridula]|nr:hypothetical protein C8J56DRAFT_1061816 [Mycena floridula]